MTQKTAMQELIETLERKINSLKDIRYKSSDSLEVVRLSGKIDGILITLQDCKYELPKERQQIIDAIKRGIEIPMNLYNEEQKQQDAIDYYNQTYNQ